MSGVGPRWSWGVAVVVAAAGVAALLLRPTAPAVPELRAAVEATTFAPAVLERVAAWVGPFRTAWVPRTLLTLGLPVLLVATPRGRRLVDRFAGRRLATTRGALLPQLVAVAASLPFLWWLGWRHAGEFGFRTAGPLRFALEAAGGFALELGITTVTVLLLLWLVRRRPSDWPAVGALLGMVLTALLVLVQPLVVNQLLYDPEPLADDTVRAAVAPIVGRSALPGTELLVGEASVRTTRVNAVVSGLGPSRQVILWDTLLALPTDRIAAVVGHELAHAEHADVPRAVLASGAGLLVVLTLAQRVLRRAGDVPLRGGRAGAVVVVAVLVVEFLVAPVVALQSRQVEAAADARALELVRDPAGQVALQRGFVIDDLADPDPPLWVELLSSHPTVGDRIRRTVAFAVTEGLEPLPGGRLMRTLWVTNDLPPRAGGIEQFVGNLLTHTWPQDALVLGPAHADATQHDAEVPWTTQRRDRGVWPTASVLAAVREAAAAHRPDVIVLGASWPLGELTGRLARDPGVPVVAISHGLEAGVAGIGLGRVVGRTTRDLAALTTISDYTEQRLAPHVRCPVRRVPPGVDVTRFRPDVDGSRLRTDWGVPAGAPLVGCVSRLVPRKGQDRLLGAWPALHARHPRAWLALVGTGPLEDDLRSRAAQLRNVVVTGGVSWEDLPVAHAAFDVFAMPCRTRLLGTDVEGLGIVYLEAQASGVPVVAGDSGGAPETIVEGRTGTVVDGRSEGALVAAIDGLLADPDRARAWGAAGREHAAAAWSWDAVATRFHAVLRGAVEGGL